jgi:hypothetical protein
MDPTKKEIPTPAEFMSMLTWVHKGRLSVTDRDHAKIYGNNRELSFMGQEKAYGL